ncbi:MAG: glycoside hydrolase family 27 protein [Anaerolineae bacterium]|nr:glycoside hydrolase family 27 protein [Anaerolineae bacterium]
MVRYGWILLLLVLLAPGRPAPVQALDNGLALTPPMGWNSWYAFRCNVSSDLIRDQARALVSLGLREAGYRYVVLDDCWSGERDADGRLTAVYPRFAGGIAALAQSIHGMRLKFGIYSSRGPRTCMDFHASQDYEAIDAQTFADWGVDYVKYDNCPWEGVSEDELRSRYQLMRDAILATGRPMLYSLSMWSFRDWHPETGHLSRTTFDIEDNRDNMLNRFDVNAAYAAYARPGYWNDPDVLYFGGGMTTTEYQTYFTLWAVSAAPLMISADLRNLPPGTLEILRQREVIAINQDPAGRQAVQLAEAVPGLQVWGKPLSSGEWAITLLNRTPAPADITFDGGSLGWSRYRVRDVWARADRGTAEPLFTAPVAPYGVVLLRVRALP